MPLDAAGSDCPMIDDDLVRYLTFSGFNTQRLSPPTDRLTSAGPIFTPRRIKTLDAVLDDLDIVPISQAFLEAYKVTEAAKHPGNPLAKHLKQVEVVIAVFTLLGCIGTLICILPLIMVLPHLGTHPWALILSTVSMCLCIMGHFSQYTKIKTPAVWVETQVYSFKQIPVEIAAVARLVQQQLPYSYLIQGTLYQGTVALDPYLLLCSGKDTIVLGIWDDGKVIAIAA